MRCDQNRWDQPALEKVRDIFSKSRERRTRIEHHPRVVCYGRLGRTEGGSRGGGLDMGGRSWRGRSRQSIAALFRRRRALGNTVAKNSGRSGGTTGLFRVGL